MAVLARSALSAVFLFSAGAKLHTATARAAFADAVAAFGAVPRSWSRAVGALLVAVELAIAIGLCLAATSRASLAGAGLLLVLFALALGNGLRRGVLLPCACFGASRAPARLIEVWRNLLLAGLAAAGAARDGSPAGLLSGPAAATVDRLLLAFFLALLAAGFVDYTDLFTPRRSR